MLGKGTHEIECYCNPNSTIELVDYYLNVCRRQISVSFCRTLTKQPELFNVPVLKGGGGQTFVFQIGLKLRNVSCEGHENKNSLNPAD